MASSAELADTKSPSAELETPSAAIVPAAPDEPRWVHELWRQLVQKVGPFATTATGFILHPKAFVTRWRDGDSSAMNPFWFAASAAAVIATLQSALLQALGAKEHVGLVESALKTLAPYAYYVEIGVAAHLILHLFGSRRRLSSSVAMALYAGGTMATLGQLLVLVLLAGFQIATPAGAVDAPAGLSTTVTLALMLSFGAFYTWFSAAMAALHGVGSARMFAANGVAYLVSSAVCDFLPLPTLHVALRIWEHGHFVRPTFHAVSPFG